MSTVHSPQPVITATSPSFDLNYENDYHLEPTLPQVRLPTSNSLYDNYQPSSIISEYFYDDSNSFPEIQSVQARHTLNDSDVIYPASSVPEPAAHPQWLHYRQRSTTTDYRRANSNFEVRRGAVALGPLTGPLVVPLDLPPLHLSPQAQAQPTSSSSSSSPVRESYSSSFSRPPRKLQKKYNPHRRSRSTGAL